MSVMTVPFGCTKQHTRDVYAVAVARNRTEQSGELTPLTSRCLPGVARAGSHVASSVLRAREPASCREGLRVVRAFRPHRVQNTPLDRQSSLSASVQSIAESFRVPQLMFANSEYFSSR